MLQDLRQKLPLKIKLKDIFEQQDDFTEAGFSLHDLVRVSETMRCAGRHELPHPTRSEGNSRRGKNARGTPPWGKSLAISAIT